MEVRTLLLLTIAILFMAVGLILAARIKEAKGSLRYAKTSIIMAALSVSGAFIVQVIMALVYDPTPLAENMILKQLYVFEDLFAMLVLTFLVSFAVFSTYTGPRRRWIILLIFIVSLIPPAYLTLDYSRAIIASLVPLQSELFVLTPPPLTDYFYAICGIPLGLAPILVFARSLISARRRGDKVSTNRTAIIFSAVIANEAEYLLYVFGGPLLEIPVLVAWIPVSIFLLYAVLKITSPLKPSD